MPNYRISVLSEEGDISAPPHITTCDTDQEAIQQALQWVNGQVMGNRRQDAWEKAAMCEANARSTKDVELQTKFLKLRDSWIRIANDAQFVNDVIANDERLENEERH